MSATKSATMSGTHASTSELIPIAKPILDGVQTAANKATGGVGGGALAWPALLRKLDRADPSFRD